MANRHFDIVVIGGGPAGYVGAIRAAQLGYKVACVERAKLGGVCLNWGCIPSKALLHVAEAYSESVTHGSEWGLSFDNSSVDWSKVIASSRGAADKLNKGVGFLMKKNAVDTIEGHARITSGRSGDSPCTIEILKAQDDYYHGDGEEVISTVTATNVMIATGAAPRALPFAPFDGDKVISSKDAMVLPEQPASLIVVGSGAIGMEFAYFYNAMGTKVTVVEMMDRILPNEDGAVSKEALKAFKKQGIEFHVGSMTTGIQTTDEGVTVTVADAADPSKTRELSADKVLVGIGVQGRCDGLFAEGLGVEMDRGHIKTDFRDVEEPTYQTSVPGIYAIGDIIGPPWLAHVSSEEAVTCVERMAGHHTLGVDYQAIPGCTYTSPQVATIGLTEEAAKEAGIEYDTGQFSFQALGKAVATGDTTGFVKILVSKPYGEILGAHIIGKDASELIHEFCLAIRLEATAEDIISTMHAHPTMAESIHEAALDSEGRVINS